MLYDPQTFIDQAHLHKRESGVTNTRHCDSELLCHVLYFCTTLLSAGPESSGLYSLSIPINTCTILLDLR